MDILHWSREQIAVVVAALFVMLLLAFSIGVEVGSKAAYSAFEAQGFRCKDEVR